MRQLKRAGGGTFVAAKNTILFVVRAPTLGQDPRGQWAKTEN